MGIHPGLLAHEKKGTIYTHLHIHSHVKFFCIFKKNRNHLYNACEDDLALCL